MYYDKGYPYGRANTMGKWMCITLNVILLRMIVVMIIVLCRDVVNNVMVARSSMNISDDYVGNSIIVDVVL